MYNTTFGIWGQRFKSFFSEVICGILRRGVVFTHCFRRPMFFSKLSEYFQKLSILFFQGFSNGEEDQEGGEAGEGGQLASNDEWLIQAEILNLKSTLGPSLSSSSSKNSKSDISSCSAQRQKASPSATYQLYASPPYSVTFAKGGGELEVCQ